MLFISLRIGGQGQKSSLRKGLRKIKAYEIQDYAEELPGYYPSMKRLPDLMVDTSNPLLKLPEESSTFMKKKKKASI